MESTAASSWKVKRTATDLTLATAITSHAHWFIPVGVGVFPKKHPPTHESQRKKRSTTMFNLYGDNNWTVRIGLWEKLRNKLATIEGSS